MRGKAVVGPGAVRAVRSGSAREPAVVHASTQRTASVRASRHAATPRFFSVVSTVVLSPRADFSATSPQGDGATLYFD